jgi:hypothetical protein
MNKLNTHNLISSETEVSKDTVFFSENKAKKSIETDFRERLAKYRIDPNEKLLAPEIVWSVKVKDKIFPAGTKGNFCAIIGKPKSKKTFSLTLFLADYLKIENDKRVLYFDTEQGKYHVQKAVKRIIQKNGIIHKNFEVYHFRSLSTAERLQLIEQAIYDYDDVDLVVIDGVRDLITSINDEEQATMITSKFLKWTEERNIHIITVLHQNKGDDKARGHVGTEIMNKAELVLSVTPSDEDKDTSFIETVVCRNIDIEPFAFKVDEFGIPHQLEDWNKPTKTNNGVKKLDPREIDNITYKEILTLCYAKTEQMKLSELIHQLQLAIHKISSVDLSIDKAKKMIVHLQNEKLIEQRGPKGTIKSFYARLIDEIQTVF